MCLTPAYEEDFGASRLNDLLSFELSPSDAVALQKRIAPLVQARPMSGTPNTIAGFDLSIRDTARAAAVVVNVDTLETVDEATVDLPVRFPYIPGLLSFREAPAVLAAYEALEVKPDVLMLDGHGLAHPRRFGIACHVGVALGVPSIGAAKSPLISKGMEPGLERGDTAVIRHRGDAVGVALRTRDRLKPVYISVGHLITLDEAIELVLRVSPRWRIPEPTRRAHTLAGQRTAEH